MQLRRVNLGDIISWDGRDWIVDAHGRNGSRLNPVTDGTPRWVDMATISHDGSFEYHGGSDGHLGVAADRIQLAMLDPATRADALFWLQHLTEARFGVVDPHNPDAVPRDVFLSRIDSYVGNSPEHRGRAERAAIPFASLVDQMWAFIITVYQNRPHSGFVLREHPGRTFTPNQMYAASFDATAGIPLPFSDRDYIALMPRDERTIRSDGVHLGNESTTRPSSTTCGREAANSKCATTPMTQNACGFAIRTLRSGSRVMPEAFDWPHYCRTPIRLPNIGKPRSDRTGRRPARSVVAGLSRCRVRSCGSETGQHEDVTRVDRLKGREEGPITNSMNVVRTVVMELPKRRPDGSLTGIGVDFTSPQVPESWSSQDVRSSSGRTVHLPVRQRDKRFP